MAIGSSGSSPSSTVLCSEERKIMNNQDLNEIVPPHDDNEPKTVNDDRQTSTVVDADIVVPTYETSEQSIYYEIAKQHLSNGDFESALSAIEEGINVTKALLDQNCEGDPTMHESMAPFHYLYGTTLLYSIEESADDQMMGDPVSMEDQDDSADDMQVAFENLEIARVILERLISARSSEKLRADLAQVYLREGDLQRTNGQYEAAISDYSNCLKYRENNMTIDPFDRKIADVHYNLALAYNLAVAETKTQAASEEEDSKSQHDLFDFRTKSLDHFLSCVKTLCGNISLLCGITSKDFFQNLDSDVLNTELVSSKVEKLRKQAAALQPLEENRDEVAVLLDLLDEIQETIDEADNSEKGVQEVSEMKAEISAAVAAQAEQEDNIATDDGKKGVTCIGFGDVKGTDTNVASATDTSNTRPMMIVKKKQKREVEDAKLPALGLDNKRVRNE
jgi:hypothetical protein